MIHSTMLCKMSKSTAMSGWATFSPDTEAVTAISARHTPSMTARRRRGSSIVTAPAPAGSGEDLTLTVAPRIDA
ncbi:hypothetical protein QTQ03_08860 [Micromonospora sp. WMMA1363]|uniref:hypothetical protein n=1 Tax=Micromonospora sp. WMMA1363 TaxID=3053985 RepID=UPI00259CA5BB|nr:hypothetical protein [Micromonospora sp. WMMA1363]MDM4719683.1 hypothetical protein [Micromonospora sp. WMMA1363]